MRRDSSPDGDTGAPRYQRNRDRLPHERQRPQRPGDAASDRVSSSARMDAHSLSVGSRILQSRRAATTPRAGAPHITMPSLPRMRKAPHADALPDGERAQPGPPGAFGDASRRARERDREGGAPGRRRENSAARPLASRSSGLQPVVVRARPPQAPYDTRRQRAMRPSPGGANGLDYDDWREDGEWETTDTWSDEAGWGDEEAVPTARAPVPALAAYASPAPVARRPLVATRAILRRARSPWSVVRMALAAGAICATLISTFTAAGEPSQAYQAFAASLGSKRLQIIAQQVKPLTSLLRPEQYDSPAQFNTYSPAACSPSVLAEVLTAWGVPDATIGHMIDDLGADLSPYWGLVTQDGFQVVAAKHHMRADISWTMSYNQILYLTNTLGLPVIVNFRRDYGYYHYLAGGHFLAVTGGDQQGVSIVDSSEYFIKYLPHDVFDGLWQWRGDGTAMTVVIVPDNYQYSLPPS